MDFRPNTNTLVANYLVTFGIVGIIIFLSTRPGNVVRYYYSPEYNSHSSYGTSNCASCHSTNWSKVTDKNCSTAGCHTQFEAGKQTTPERLAATKDEFGNVHPRFGAILAFHDKVIGQTSCESCHPSHRLPQKGRFNNETMVVAMQQIGEMPRDPAAVAKRRADVFHRGAEQIIGKVSCNTCHADMDASGQVSSSAAASAVQQIAASSAEPSAPAATQSTPPPTPIPAAPEAIPPTPTETATVPQANATPNIATGDLLSLPPMATNTTTSSPTSGSSTNPALPNLFEAAGKASGSSRQTEDHSSETPN